MRIVVVGEGMLELSRGGSSADTASAWCLGYGGDTLNTAIHLARCGEHVAYMTSLGVDPFSDALAKQWAAEGLDTSLILTDPSRLPGLYAIHTDAAGERSFSYWRGESAARRTFALLEIAQTLSQVEQADLLVFSLISLAILPNQGRAALLALAARMRNAGSQVAFDGNFRSNLWSDLDDARAWRDHAISVCTIGLPTLEDELAMEGAAGDAEQTAVRWRAAGAGQVIVKMGADGCLLPDGDVVPPPQRLVPLDTSGAGDAFNAGYLHAFLHGAEPRAAALAGHRLAGWTVMRPGALPPRDADGIYVRLLD